MITRNDIMLWMGGFAAAFSMLMLGMHFLMAPAALPHRSAEHTYGGFAVELR